MFIVGYAQGHLFSVAQGEEAYEDLRMHEFYNSGNTSILLTFGSQRINGTSF
jgi:hypothetical protein